MSAVQCFMVEPANRARRYLRRFRWTDPSPCQSGSCCDARFLIDEVPGTIIDGAWDFPPMDLPPPDDPRWPQKCEACGTSFSASDEYQVFHTPLWVNPLDGTLYTRQGRAEAPGMMFDAFWLHDHPEWCGPDGRSIHVVCPDGHTWCIDSRASNCTMPEEKAHKCWVRHGDPPNLTVDKNGMTCAAGAGSIQTPKWHGFLTGGILSESR